MLMTGKTVCMGGDMRYMGTLIFSIFLKSKTPLKIKSVLKSIPICKIKTKSYYIQSCK